eukprot:1143122-Pelagomonas_calceolata.AAC.1
MQLSDGTAVELVAVAMTCNSKDMLLPAEQLAVPTVCSHRRKNGLRSHDECGHCGIMFNGLVNNNFGVSYHWKTMLRLHNLVRLITCVTKCALTSHPPPAGKLTCPTNGKGYIAVPADVGSLAVSKRRCL